MALYAGGVATLAAATWVLLLLERAVGVPPPFRGYRLNPLVSPALALIGLVVSSVLAIPFVIVQAVIGAGQVSGIAGDDIAWYVLCAATLVVAAYLTARWWQPVYLSVVIWAFFTVGALYEHYEAINEPQGQTASDIMHQASWGAPVLAALTSVGALIRFLQVRASHRTGDVTGAPTTGVHSKPTPV